MRLSGVFCKTLSCKPTVHGSIATVCSAVLPGSGVPVAASVLQLSNSPAYFMASSYLAFVHMHIGEIH
jgi:hypothetical protein